MVYVVLDTPNNCLRIVHLSLRELGQHLILMTFEEIQQAIPKCPLASVNDKRVSGG